MFDGEIYADFVVLWLLCHQSRVEGERSELTGWKNGRSSRRNVARASLKSRV